MKDNFITVSLLNTFIKNSLDSEQLLAEVTVVGEVSGAKMSGAHLYFTLKDEGAAISCNSFNAMKTYVPKDGESVIIKGKIDYYVKGGRLSLNCNKIENFGAGMLALRFEELKRKLLAEGLFATERKKEIPAYCKKVGVITSKTGAVIRDIITTVRRYNRSIDIILCDTRVQGMGAEKELLNNLEFMDNQGFDVIIIARGGGSLADLEPFNTEVLARGISKAKTPIISAVGHETDYTICDMVSDMRCATPTAAAELVAYGETELLEYFIRTAGNIQSKINRSFSEQKVALVNYADIIKNRMSRVVSDKKSQIVLLSSILKNRIENVHVGKKTILEKLMIELSSKNPMTILQKGYFKIKMENEYLLGNTVVSIGDNLEIIAANEHIYATVSKVVATVDNLNKQ